MFAGWVFAGYDITGWLRCFAGWAGSWGVGSFANCLSILVFLLFHYSLVLALWIGLPGGIPGIGLWNWIMESEYGIGILVSMKRGILG